MHFLKIIKYHTTYHIQHNNSSKRTNNRIHVFYRKQILKNFNKQINDNNYKSYFINHQTTDTDIIIKKMNINIIKNNPIKTANIYENPFDISSNTSA